MNKKNLAIIDSDSIAYLGGKEDSLQQILEKVDYKIQEILDETKADYYVLLISKGKYFRHDISKSKETPKGSYKANRTYTTQPWVKTIKEYLIVKHKAIWYSNLEADDVAAWLVARKLYLNKGGVDAEHSFEKIDSYIPDSPYIKSSQEINKILVAKDKDLLYSIPGKHLNFSKKLEKDIWGMEWIETSECDAASFVKSQMIIGDSSDGISGLYRKGKAYWNKISADVVPSWGEILQLYIVDYGESKGIYEFQKNFRLLHMLNSDEDMLREVGYIPQLPEFQKVVKEEIITNDVNKIEF